MGNFSRWLQYRVRRLLRRHPKPIWFLVAAHIVALGLALCLFALLHHVLSYERESLGVVSVRGNAAQTAYNAAASGESAEDADPVLNDAPDANEPGAAQEAASVGDFSERFADKFISGDPILTEGSYVSENVNIAVTGHHMDVPGHKIGINYFVADIYVRDISCLKTAFAQDKFGKNITESMNKVMTRENAMVIMNGDFYGVRTGGVCIRNGQLYTVGEIVRDIGVLYWDGSFEWYPCNEFDYQECMDKGAYQAWNFGPALLDENGKPRTSLEGEYYTDINDNNPRAAFGYYEPGHYCFICVDGRSDTSRGIQLTKLAELAESMGLRQCYNMDGGRTAELAFDGRLINSPGTGIRKCSDFICVVDRVER